jgi:hypothetical protein
LSVFLPPQPDLRREATLSVEGSGGVTLGVELPCMRVERKVPLSNQTESHQRNNIWLFQPLLGLRALLSSLIRVPVRIQPTDNFLAASFSVMGSVRQLRSEWNTLYSRQQEISTLFDSLLAKKKVQLEARTSKLQSKTPITPPTNDRTPSKTLSKSAERSIAAHQRLEKLQSTQGKNATALHTITLTKRDTPSLKQTKTTKENDPKQANVSDAQPVKVERNHIPANQEEASKPNHSKDRKEAVISHTSQQSQTEQMPVEETASQTTNSPLLEASTQTHKNDTEEQKKLQQLVCDVDGLLVHFVDSLRKVITNRHKHVAFIPVTFPYIGAIATNA